MKRRSPRHFLRDTWQEILTTDGSAEIVARSFALGTLLALTPTFGFGIFVGIGLLVIYPGLHKPALLSAFAVWNPLMQIPIYSAGIYLGALIFQDMPIVSFDFWLWNELIHVTRRVIVGTLIVGMAMTMFSYIFIYASIRRAKGKPVFRA